MSTITHGRGLLTQRTFYALAVASVVAGCTVNVPAPTTTVTVTAAAQEQAEVDRESTKDAGPAPVAEATPSSEVPATAQSAPSVPETFAVPALLGMNLQDAQDTLQLSGSYVLDQEDASGLERFQVNDSNWYVCRQDPAPGTVVAVDATITLASVKMDEICP